MSPRTAARRTLRALLAALGLALLTLAPWGEAQAHKGAGAPPPTPPFVYVIVAVVLAVPFGAFAVFFRAIWRANTAPESQEEHVVPAAQPLELCFHGTGAPQLLWLSFRFPAGHVHSRWVRRDIGLAAQLSLDGGPTLGLGAGAMAPPGLLPVGQRIYNPVSGGGELRGMLVLLRLRARPPGQPMVLRGMVTAHAPPNLLRLWTSADKWPRERRVEV